jgi:hypothetical protein
MLIKPHLTTQATGTAQERKSAMSTRGRLSVAAVTVTCATLAVLGVGTSALASNATSNSIKACYKTGATLPPLDHIGTTGTCPTGDSSLTWNIVGPKGATGPQGATGPTGPQGPAGISEGVQAFSNTETFINQANTGIGVIQTPAVSTTGDYYVSASLSSWVSAADFVYCWVEFAPVGDVAEVTMPSGGANYQSLSLNADVHVTAGSPVAVACESPYGMAGTYVNSADVNATLISNDNGATANVTRGPRMQPMPRLPQAHSAR